MTLRKGNMMSRVFITLITAVISFVMLITSGCSQPAKAAPGITQNASSTTTISRSNTPLASTTPRLTIIPGKQGVNLGAYAQIALDAASIEASCVYKDFGPANLLQVDSFWHVPVPKTTNEAWVMVDLGSARQLSAIAVKPRTDFLSHLWRGDEATLEGSNDNRNWTRAITLELNNNMLKGNDWVSFILPKNTVSFRYYRIFIDSASFMSMGGLRLYGEGGAVLTVLPASPTKPLPSTPAAQALAVVTGVQGADLSVYGQLTLDARHIAVSIVFQNYGAANLLQENSFWHVPVPKTTNEAWVMVDLVSARKLSALSIKPRADFLSQLWKGGDAILEGSSDNQTWKRAVVLELNHDKLKENEWINFILPKDMAAFRYYRIFIDSPDFISMTGLRLYGEAAGAPPPQISVPWLPGVASIPGKQDINLTGHSKIYFDPYKAQVSSEISANNGKLAAFNPYNFWHVKVPRETSEAWIIIDLESARKISAISVEPRKGFLSQLWHGASAVLEGSDDNQSWTPEVKLELNHDKLSENKTIVFVLPEDIPVLRYQRIFINDPLFFSLSNLRFHD
jgi:hypothetical protein